MSKRIEKKVSAESLLRQEEFKNLVFGLEKTHRSYYIQTFGCQLNDHDSENLAGLLEEMGFVAAGTPEEADLFLLNTCSIRENADQRFYGHLGQAKKWRQSKRELIVIVCGCMMKIDEHVDKIRRSYPFVDIIFGPQDIYRFPELLFRRLTGSRRIYDIGDQDVIAEGLAVVHERKHRALCTIMYGCNNFCSYCIVPYTRGRERSRDVEAIVAEVQQLAAEGFSEVMLLGQNVNSYGLDLPKISEKRENNFAALLEKLCLETSIPRLRFMTSHPKDISIELLDVMATYPQIERHLHLPLQSGSDRILKKMRRSYTVERYRKMVAEARQRLPQLSFSTDIIVGFPSETEEDFQGTLEMVREVGYDSAFTFMYSPRYGTPAALLEEQIPADVMQERFERLIELQNHNALVSNQKRVGKRYEVLIEGLSEHSGARLTGRCSDAHLINFSIPDSLLADERWQGLSAEELGAKLEGHFAVVEVTEAKTFSMLGEMVAYNGKTAVFDENIPQKDEC